MIDMSSSSNLTVREMMDDAIHRARADAAGVDADKLVDERIAELEAAREIDQKVIAWLGAACDRTYDALAAARCWAAAWKRAASKFRAWQADTEAALEQERRALDVLAKWVAADWLARNPTKGGCIEASGDAWAALARKQVQLRAQLRAQAEAAKQKGAEWAQQQARAREEAAKTGTTQKGNG